MKSRAIPTLPMPVARALRKLGSDICDARRQRRISTAIMAKRYNVVNWMLTQAVELDLPILKYPLIPWKNNVMNENITLPDLHDASASVEADSEAVQRFLETGEPLDPAVASRVRYRSESAREASFQRIGYVSIEAFLRPCVDDE